MPAMPDAEVVIAGQALFITDRFDFNTKAPNGCDVSILGATGLAIIRFRQEDIEAGHLPQLGKPLAFVVSGSSWAQDRGAANVVYRFKRAAGENDLGELHKSIKAAEAARAAVRGAAA